MNVQTDTVTPEQLFNLSQTLPRQLNAGECEAIALAQHRQGRLLSNDKRAMHYCDTHGIEALDLVDILRLLWTRRIISQREVEQLIEAMTTVEKLTLSQVQREVIFAPCRRKS